MPCWSGLPVCPPWYTGTTFCALATGHTQPERMVEGLRRTPQADRRCQRVAAEAAAEAALMRQPVAACVPVRQLASSAQTRVHGKPPGRAHPQRWCLMKTARVTTSRPTLSTFLVSCAARRVQRAQRAAIERRVHPAICQEEGLHAPTLPSAWPARPAVHRLRPTSMLLACPCRTPPRPVAAASSLTITIYDKPGAMAALTSLKVPFLQKVRGTGGRPAVGGWERGWGVGVPPGRRLCRAVGQISTSAA